jgi:N-acetylmuramoyl-L-alanine amidase
MSYLVNIDWLDKTANKSPGGAPWLGVVVHETASPNPDNPAGTLNYNLSADVGSSYHDLIGRDGVCYRYLDPDRYVAWHAGVKTKIWVDGHEYTGGEVNAFFLGIELDGKCDGTPATDAQLSTMTMLLNQYGDRYGFTRDSAHLIMHSTAVAPIDPSYRSDARCTTIADLVTGCQAPPLTLATYERRYRVRYNRSVVRQGPARSFPIAGYLNAGHEFWADSLKFGERIEGDDRWIHASSGAGFISATAVEQIT